MILHWGSPQPSLCSHPCCSSASPQSITHKCPQELVQSPAKSWVGIAGGFTSSSCGCTLVNDWEVRMTNLFIYLFRRKGTFPVGVVPGRGCHLELSLLWHWGSHAHWHSSLLPNSAQHQPQPDTRNLPKTPGKGWFVTAKCQISEVGFLKASRGKAPQPSGHLWIIRSVPCWGDTDSGFCLLQSSVFEQPLFPKPGIIVLE